MESGAPNATISRQALAYYEQAVALDSSFVKASSRLARGEHLQSYHIGR